MNAVMQRHSNRDIYLFAMIMSIALSCWLSIRETVINPDAICYLLSAETIGQSGFRTAMQLCGQAKWPLYSALIYGIANFSHLSYLSVAYLIDGLFTLLSVTLFIAICKELGGTRRVLWLAALVILLAHDFNSVRQYIVRDHGFFTFYLASLFFLLRYFREPKFLTASLFSISLLIAALFRIEGAIFLLALPFLAWLKPNSTLGQRSQYFFSLSFPVILMMLAGLAWLSLHPQLSLEKFGRVTEVINQLQHGFAMMAKRFQLTKVSMMRHVLTESSARDAGLVLILTLSFLYLLNIISNLSLIYSALVIYAWVKKAAPFTSSAALILFGYLVINLFISLGFFAENLFLSKRYLVAFSLILMLWVPFALEQLHARHKKTLWLIYLLILLSALGGIIDFGYSKKYVKNAGDWLADNVPSTASLYTNDIQLMYYSHHFGQQIFATQRDYSDVNVIASERWKKYDYIALRFNPKDQDDDAVLVANEIQLVPVKEFTNKRGDRVNIYQVRKEESVS